MSMYDELICHYTLPDGFDATGHVFQTTDTPDQWLTLYCLQADGTLVRADTYEPLAHHGALTFYTGNVCCTGPQGYATSDDQPAWWAEYTCLFDHGVLLKIEGGHGPHTDVRGTHLTRAAWHAAQAQPGQEAQL